MVSIAVDAAVDAAIAAVTAGIEGSVEKAAESAVITSISSGITAMVETAITAAIEAATAAGAVSAAQGLTVAKTTEVVQAALKKGLNQNVKDVIGSDGLKDLSTAMTTMPSDVVVDMLAKAAFDAINPHLWVFSDPAYLRLARLVRALRAVQKGKKPEYDDDVEDDDEEKRRYFREPEAADKGNDFLFFTVFKNSECKDDKAVYSMSLQWKHLMSLVDDPIAGVYVSHLFREIFDSCVEDTDTGETAFPILVGGTGTAKVVGAKFGRPVKFGDMKVYNVHGSSKDKTLPNWVRAYRLSGYGKCNKCYIAQAKPPCGHNDPLVGNIVGGHLWNPELKEADKSLYYYILPICRRHNKRIVYDKPRDDGSGWMRTKPESIAMKITACDKVPGWGGMVKQLIGSKTSMMTAVAGKETVGNLNEIILPKQLTQWLTVKVHALALESSKTPIETVLKEVSAVAMGKLKSIIKSAGKDAENWAKKEGHDIMLKSLIPIYGIYVAAKRLPKLKEEAIARFHSNARMELEKYKVRCLGDEKQERRKQRLVEETNKVIISKSWRGKVKSLEGIIATKVPILVMS